MILWRKKMIRTLSKVRLVTEAWKNVSVLDRVVVEGTEDVGGNDGSEVVSELIVVGAAKDAKSIMGQLNILHIHLSTDETNEPSRQGESNSLVLNIDESLAVGVSEVALMGRSQMDLGLVERVVDLVGEDAGRETRDELDDLVLMRGLENVVVDEEVVAKEGRLLSHVSEETSD